MRNCHTCGAMLGPLPDETVESAELECAACGAKCVTSGNDYRPDLLPPASPAPTEET